jgi:multidrug efflux pump
MRLGPILVTSFAFILGVVPLVLAKEAGAETGYTLGRAVSNGMLGVTLFGIFFTRVFYVVIRWLTGPGKAAPLPTLVSVGADGTAALPSGDGAGEPAATTPAVSATAIQAKPGHHHDV